MILNKYNEIMDRITVDPEMKGRVMGAVSAAIKDQAKGSAAVTEIPKHTNRSSVKAELRRGSAPEAITHADPEPQPIRKKKSKKVPIAIITSIAAVIVVLLGALLIFYRMGTSNAPSIYKHNSEVGGAYATAETTVAVHNAEAEDVEAAVDSVMGNYAAEETTTAGGNLSAGAATYGDSVSTKDGDYLSTNWNGITVRGQEYEDEEGIGDERIDRISKTLPFELKGSGTGVYADDINLELFLGEQGQKVILLTGPEGKDLVGAYEPHGNKAGETKTTPAGTQVTLYTIEFGNVTDINSGDPTLANAALFTRNGQTYLVIFSALQSTDVILSVADVM